MVVYMLKEEVKKELFNLQDVKYRDFQSKLLPTVNPDTVIGVRTPALRAYAKTLIKREDIEEYLSVLPHEYFDENQLHGFIICEMKEYNRAIDYTDKFLPYIDNWATCDQLSPKIFKKYKNELLERINKWIESNKTYTVRFAIGMLMEHFLDKDFDISYPETVAKVQSDEYYVNMMIAWYFATALAKQYDSVIPFIEEKRLDEWTHNKTISKSVESNRIPEDRKKYLKSLKIK